MVSDEGALESLTGALITLLLLVAMMFMTGLALTTQYQRARTAADLAALAAAGSQLPCDTARAVASRNGAVLMRCVMEQGNALVTVSMPTGMRTFALPSRIEVSARAGLPSAGDSVLQ